MARKMHSLAESMDLVTVRHHEASTIFSFDISTDQPLELLQPRIQALMEAVQNEVNRQDGIVGHIKAYVSDTGASAAFSGTGDEIHITYTSHRTTQIHFTAIVFGCTEEPIAALMEHVISGL